MSVRSSLSSETAISSQTAIRDSSVLRRVSSLGSARSGLADWRLQRLTALALVPLGLYFVASVLTLATSKAAPVGAWLAQPLNALLMLLVVMSVFVHAVLGLRSIFMDYIHTRKRLLVANLVLQAAAFLFGLAGLLAILNAFVGHGSAA